MQKKRRNGRAPAKTSAEDEIAHLRGLDLKGLHARWRSLFQRPAPTHLTRHLLFAVIAYRLQADRFGVFWGIRGRRRSGPAAGKCDRVH